MKEALRGALEGARKALDRDRTGLAAALNEAKKIAGGWQWLADGEWGSYDYTQRTEATLRKEVGWCLLAIRKAADDALNASGKLATVAIRDIDAALALARKEKP